MDGENDLNMAMEVEEQNCLYFQKLLRTKDMVKHCFIVKWGGMYKQQNLSNSCTRKVDNTV